jgi:hypothetical protein
MDATQLASVRELRRRALSLLDDAVAGLVGGPPEAADTVHRLQRVSNDLGAIELSLGRLGPDHRGPKPPPAASAA